MQKNLDNAFYITEDEYKTFEDWKEQHIKDKHNCDSYSGAIGGRFSYEFCPTSIGTFKTIKCSCGDEFCFSEAD